MKIGVMQGRLLPPTHGRFQCFPRDGWAEEFPLAKQAGLFSIEWIYDLFGEDANPLATDLGVEKIRRLTERYSVGVHSVCADYFMDKPLLRASGNERRERIEKLLWLLERCQLLPIYRIVLPFVDASRIETPSEAMELAAIVNPVVETAAAAGIELHLETSLPPGEFSALLARMPHPFLKVNYDSGNSASLGFNVREEFAAYGERVGSVHIKDRIRGGGTVPLGTGGANLPALCEELKKALYSRELILQVARGSDGDEVAWVGRNRAIVEKLWQDHFQPASTQ